MDGAQAARIRPTKISNRFIESPILRISNPPKAN